jgi:DNA-binding transcriptional MerR regulator
LTSTLHIGELAARCGRSVHAIRWYDAQGLIPGVARDGGGRRVFTERHVEWLALVDRLRSTGMAVADIRRYAALVRQGRTGVPGQHELLAEHRTRVASALADWQAALDLLDGKLAFYEEWLASGVRPTREVRRSGNGRGAPKRRR